MAVTATGAKWTAASSLISTDWRGPFFSVPSLGHHAGLKVPANTCQARRDLPTRLRIMYALSPYR